jgi:hypothetical protein
MIRGVRAEVVVSIWLFVRRVDGEKGGGAELGVLAWLKCARSLFCLPPSFFPFFFFFFLILPPIW